MPERCRARSIGPRAAAFAAIACGVVGVATAGGHGEFDADDYYHTGDVLRKRPDGRYEFVSRVKDLIKILGEQQT